MLLYARGCMMDANSGSSNQAGPSCRKGRFFFLETTGRKRTGKLIPIAALLRIPVKLIRGTQGRFSVFRNLEQSVAGALNKMYQQRLAAKQQPEEQKAKESQNAGGGIHA